MAVKRIVVNIASDSIAAAETFYQDILGMELAMDFGWIQTYVSDGEAAPQLSIASEGGSGTPVPDMSIEVDNFDEVLRRVVAADLPVEYGPVSEPWGVKRFYVRDPFNRLINILVHE